ncbi:MAG: FHA domain-containing protein [Deltaproteobacteria bacterium]|nr:FHA domain-containing protein [Deltaproteobacteria bacterium]
MQPFDFHIQDVLPLLNDAALFLEHVTTWVMVGPPPEDPNDDWSFRTGSIQTVQDAESGNTLVLEPNYEVRLLKKAQPGPFQDTILVGRSTTSDVVIPDTSISKLHMRIRLEAATVADANSSNGTTYNDVKLKADEVVPLTDASTLLLGERSFFLFSPEKFRTLLLKSIGQMPR